MVQQDEPGSFPLPPPPELYGYVENPAALHDGSDSEDENQDIYRGPPPEQPRSPSPSPSTETSSSSSSGGSVFGGRLGAISAGVEHAISRWARAWMSSSSLSSSSSSSSSASIITFAKSQTTRRRKRRPRSLATLHNARSEREVAARIRAREDLRNVPRGFVLYTPTPATAGPERGRRRDAPHEPVFRTMSLPEVTTRLNGVLKERTKARRNRTEHISPAPSRPLSPPYNDYMLSDGSSVAKSTPGLPVPPLSRDAKGKQRAPTPHNELNMSGASTTKSQLPGSLNSPVPKAWWLDVSSPTWEDMCAIGKLLHLHPLTLEDILTQDPREKLELFPKLGYYFISFRAIESQKTRDRLRNILSVDDEALQLTDAGLVAEVNVYLVVFREGICTFHFADIEEHVDRVRTRIMLLGESINTSSDWIAHGMLDSIVDSFFPFLEVIEREVLGIEHLVFTVGGDTGLLDNTAFTKSQSQSSGSATALLSEKITVPEVDEKHSFVDISGDKDIITSISPRPRFYAPTSFPLLMRRARRAFCEAISAIPRFKATKPTSPEYHPTTTIHRMARARRLVTSLTRFLAVKSEVVAQVKKRLLTQGEWGLGNGTEDDLDVFVYMGDVQDHILTLQQSLAHYERMLNQSHPTHLAQLRVSVNRAKAGTDKAIVSLTVISLGVLCVQTLLALASMNCEIPANPTGTNQFDIFAIVIALSVLIMAIYGIAVRHWWIQAKRRRLTML
ncbi:hypothetical protein C2E23DRAFT_718900 [Lenzites betulinus]|nr:hypothetical protein C2E23DRAFT_718900 [Lenzites betulinus]